MECPVCHDSAHVEIDTHADGFAANLEECGTCGAMWTLQGEKEIMIHGPTRTLAMNA